MPWKVNLPSASQRRKFFSSQRVGAVRWRRERGFSAAGRAGDFVVGGGALLLGLRWAWGSGAWLCLVGRGVLRVQAQGEEQRSRAVEANARRMTLNYAPR